MGAQSAKEKDIESFCIKKICMVTVFSHTLHDFPRHAGESPVAFITKLKQENSTESFCMKTFYYESQSLHVLCTAVHRYSFASPAQMRESAAFMAPSSDDRRKDAAST